MTGRDNREKAQAAAPGAQEQPGPKRLKSCVGVPRACRQHLHACQAGRPRPARPSLQQQQLRKPDGTEAQKSVAAAAQAMTGAQAQKSAESMQTAFARMPGLQASSGAPVSFLKTRINACCLSPNCAARPLRAAGLQPNSTGNSSTMASMHSLVRR
eukprot:CAMPEP_0179429126 /NCGR_PEP_ID=MMETSP0799-20121207/14593_1 /TAXON_ID=46947 /ORGANISM="Geminigera cryophila, Strain CCMP2564" /LENGTH=155 /DNA_ID=CAMNT_0021204899 /DNA_START=139 /DNA_END=607 /DNA_ORIENTATION=+